MRSTLAGSAASAAWARAIGPVSAWARYSTPAGDRYWTDWASAGALARSAATMAARSVSAPGMGAPRYDVGRLMVAHTGDNTPPGLLRKADRQATLPVCPGSKLHPNGAGRCQSFSTLPGAS